MRGWGWRKKRGAFKTKNANAMQCADGENEALGGEVRCSEAGRGICEGEQASGVVRWLALNPTAASPGTKEPHPFTRKRLPETTYCMRC